MKFLVLTVLSGLIACTWVKPEGDASGIALVKAAHAENCTKLGEVSAAVEYRVAGLKRGPEKVARELVTLAKNEALSMSADAIVAIGEPFEGKQSFEAYRCAPEG